MLQWLREDEDIDGATDPGYVLADVDIGLLIGLRVTATNVAGSSSALAEPVGPILPAP
jgi:hypothetical protein